MLVVDQHIQIPLRELSFTFARSSGPGGQRVNKANTKATLHWNVVSSPNLPEDVRERFLAKYRRRINADGQLVLASQRFRDQGRNVADCLSKLQAMLASVATARKQRKATRPPRSAARRRLQDKRALSQKKQRRRPPALED